MTTQSRCCFLTSQVLLYILLWYSKRVNHTTMYREKHLLKSLWPSDAICEFLSKGVSWSDPAGSANLKILSEAVCVLSREISADLSGISWAHLDQRPLTIKLLSFFLLKYKQKTIYYKKWYDKTKTEYLSSHISISDGCHLINNDKLVYFYSVCVCMANRRQAIIWTNAGFIINWGPFWPVGGWVNNSCLSGLTLMLPEVPLKFNGASGGVRVALLDMTNCICCL